MGNDSTEPDAIEFVLHVERLHAALAHVKNSGASGERNLGGSLLYVGELDERSRALVVAGNVAGAATLAASADVHTQKQAIRDGVVDFLVTSLDEALRILKNEVRKRKRIAVCVGLSPERIEREMAERGVQPDLTWQRLRESSANEVRSELMWSVDSAPAQWLSKLDAIAIECLNQTQQIESRWLRLAPRHLGRMAQGFRAINATQDFATRFIARVQEEVESGEIEVAVSIQFVDSAGTLQRRFTPR